MAGLMHVIVFMLSISHIFPLEVQTWRRGAILAIVKTEKNNKILCLMVLQLLNKFSYLYVIYIMQYMPYETTA